MSLLRMCRTGAPGIPLVLVMLGVMVLPQLSPAQISDPANRDHYKAWRTLPVQDMRLVNVRDQFMRDSLVLMGLELLANPVKKIHLGDTSYIRRPNDHLNWYRAAGRDTSIALQYVNQFESREVTIGMVEYLLVPTQKLPHPPPDSLDHYKAYHIMDAPAIWGGALLQDQFDVLFGEPEFTDSLRPLFFLTPAVKNMEQAMPFDSVTHYVAYEILPKRFFPTPYPVTVHDQFETRTVQVLHSDLLLVPSRKILQPPQLGSICGTKFNDLDCSGQWNAGEPGLAGWTINLTGPVNTSVVTGAGGVYCFNNLPAGQYTVSEVLQAGWTQTAPPPPGTWSVILLAGGNVLGIDFGNCVQTTPPDTGRDHFKSWRVLPQQFSGFATVMDQFMRDTLSFTSIELLSNPVMKIHDGDTSHILRPNNHLTWYRASGRDTTIGLGYVNQFESRDVTIGMVEFLLIPTQKLPHAPPESLDHYKAYSIIDAGRIWGGALLEDQFDIGFGFPEYVDSLRPAYFLTPAIKNSEQQLLFDSVTHYVAYEVFPKRFFPTPLAVGTIDQFGSHSLVVMHSQFLLVPSRKILQPPPLGSICGVKFNDVNGNTQRDPGEPGLAGWTINLTGPVITSVMTGAGGGYCFNNLPAGQYTVSEVLQAGWTQTMPPPPGTYGIALLPGQNVVNVDFGNWIQEPQPGGGRNHFKTWMHMPLPLDRRVLVQDQFMADSLQLTMLECLSNPVKKIHALDTFNIVDPNHHLSWYRALGRDTTVRLIYTNQIESTAVSIGPVEYLLVPALKVPHAPPESLDHYKAYTIVNSSDWLQVPLWLRDEHDSLYGVPEIIDSVRPAYFLTPAIKNNELAALYDSVTHYVAYEIAPERIFQIPVNTIDQFGPHEPLIQASRYLLVPSRKTVLPCGRTILDTVMTGWNLVSLSLTGIDPAVANVFPNAVSRAFAFVSGTGYVERDTLVIGAGYWLKFSAAEIDTFVGCPIACDTIPVVAGWNLIGMISSPVATSSITSIPSGIITSSFFGYGSGGYTAATTLLPFKAYWVKVSQAGSLILCSSGGGP